MSLIKPSWQRPLVALAFLLALPTIAPAAELLDGLDLKSRHLPVTIVAEPGVVLPALRLLELERSGEIVVEVTSGEGSFLLKDSTEAARKYTSTGEIVIIPKMIIGAKRGSETFVTVTVDGEPIGKPFRFAVVDEGGIAEIASTPSLAPAVLYLDLDKKFAIVDMEAAELLRSTRSEEGQSSLVPPEGWCPDYIWLAPEPDDPFPFEETCGASLLGGRVTWEMSNPGESGLKFSWKPEEDTVLQWATGVPPGQEGCERGTGGESRRQDTRSPRRRRAGGPRRTSARGTPGHCEERSDDAIPTLGIARSR